MAQRRAIELLLVHLRQTLASRCDGEVYAHLRFVRQRPPAAEQHELVALI
jgi:hypothetical protein